jgi:RNA polymerase sigma-70 factor (ECF subfamily)
MTFPDNQRQFDKLVETMGDRLYRLCRGYLYAKDEVDDLFQDVLINIWKSLERFRNESSLETWAYRIAVNTALMHNRKATRRTAMFRRMKPADFDRHPPEEEADNDRREDLERLRRCIARLAPDGRLIISLVLEELSYQEISEIVGISPNYVGVKINRIKRQLEKELLKDDHESR